MSFINPKNESILSLSAYFIVGGLLSTAYQVTDGFTASPALQIPTTTFFESFVFLFSLAISLGILFFGITLKKFISPSRVKYLKFFIIISYGLGLILSTIDALKNAEVNLSFIISTVVGLLIIWYIYTAISSLSKKTSIK